MEDSLKLVVESKYGEVLVTLERTHLRAEDAESGMQLNPDPKSFKKAQRTVSLEKFIELGINYLLYLYPRDEADKRSMGYPMARRAITVRAQHIERFMLDGSLDNTRAYRQEVLV